MLSKLIRPKRSTRYCSPYQALHLDMTLLFFISLLAVSGLFILYSASNQNIRVVEFQIIHFLFAFFVMFLFAQIPPVSLQRSAFFIYSLALLLLISVLVMGHMGKGAQRWLNVGLMRFQPAEIMKLAIPLLLAWYYHWLHLPVTLKSTLIALPIIFIPAFLTAKQPDLSTATILVIAGSSVLFLGGLSYTLMGITILVIGCIAPFAWFLLHDYQRHRVLTFLNPENDPLGKGYHIIQSKIAVGSGGVFGKGWLNGTQSSLHFLPEHSTDFIFAVAGEEFGFVGCIILLVLFMLIVLRGLYITINAQDTFSRLLAGSITFTFFASFFINICMVTGLLPVMGVPLPLVSYGGSAMVAVMASFGILMSIQTHRRLL